MIRNFTLSRLKPYFFSLQTLNPSRNPNPLLLQQQCPVSGTAKGKAKLKTGQPLKRSKIPKKKGSKSASESGSRSHDSSDRFDKMVDACLNAPSPIRHLTPKQLKREGEREKLGLISKARQREIDEMKAKVKAEIKEKKKSETPVQESPAIGSPGMDLISLGLIDVEKIPRYELTVEDGRRLAKEYSRVLMRQTRERQAAETTLLRLKREAIDALPENLRAAAMMPDLTPFPANRFTATLTPPIDGYSEMINEAAKKNFAREKRR